MTTPHSHPDRSPHPFADAFPADAFSQVYDELREVAKARSWLYRTLYPDAAG